MNSMFDEESKPKSKPPSKLSKLFNKFFNFKAWGDFERSKAIAMYFINLIKKLFIPQKINKENIKSFDEVVAAMNLTEESIAKNKKNLQRMYRVMLVIAFVFYAYAMYQVLYGGSLGVILSLALMLVCLALAFRYNFWYFQISRRQLGCSLKFWFVNTFMGRASDE